MAFEVYHNRVKQYEITPTYDPSTRTLIGTLTAEQIDALPLIAELRVRFDDKYPFKAQLKPTTEGSDDGVVGYNVTLSGDSYTVVEIMGMDLVTEQVAIATDKAAEAVQGAEAATISAATAEEKANEATQNATAALQAAETAELWGKQAINGYYDYGPYNAQTNTPTLTADADDLKQGALLARLTVTVGGVLNFAGANFTPGTAVQNYDELRGNEAGQWYLVPGPFKPSDDITVQNYADAVPYFSGDVKRRIWVLTDNAYYEGGLSFYDYTPGIGEALLGWIFNYKDNS